MPPNRALTTLICLLAATVAAEAKVDPQGVARRLHGADPSDWQEVCHELGLSGSGLPEFDGSLDSSLSEIRTAGVVNAARVSIYQATTDVERGVILYFSKKLDSWRVEGWIAGWVQFAECCEFIRPARGPSFLRVRTRQAQGTGIHSYNDRWFALSTSGSFETVCYGAGAVYCGGPSRYGKEATSVATLQYADDGTLVLQVKFKVTIESSWPDDPPVVLFSDERTISWLWDAVRKRFEIGFGTPETDRAWLENVAEWPDCVDLITIHESALTEAVGRATADQVRGLKSIFENAGDSPICAKFRQALEKR